MFAVVVTGELLVFVLVLAQPGAFSWTALGLLSLFVQWIALASAALLCILRPLLERLGDVRAGVAAWGLVLLVAALVAGFGHVLLGEPAAARAEFVLRVLAIAAIVAAVLLRYLQVQYQARLRLLSEADARIDALQARIRPHFLFNSLNTIASMIPAAPEKAEAAVEDLADLFRAALGRGRRLVSLAEELELGRGYLRMEALRLDARLQVAWDTAALPNDALLPPLTLQPLLENAVRYGVEPREQGGCVQVNGAREGDGLRLTIRNPASAGRGPGGGFGIAQNNVRERLKLAFGEAADLRLSREGPDYRLDIHFPYRRAPDATDDRR
ncbi:sensor histidine kinase [Alkalilimnicola sp. S0819]|nr:sensor histidine kinase [Alkalilimnicola sp. S0819]MPQ17339.1 sensor histidine kinase [Alkalilimnicola sp. S0819]